jgi:hypothetical protein
MLPKKKKKKEKKVLLPTGVSKSTAHALLIIEIKVALSMPHLGQKKFRRTTLCPKCNNKRLKNMVFTMHYQKTLHN